MSNVNLQTIDLDQLALVTGGEGGTFEHAGQRIGEAGGHVLANLTPPPYRAAAQAVLPPAGRAAGGAAGRAVDHYVSRLPRLW